MKGKYGIKAQKRRTVDELEQQLVKLERLLRVTRKELDEERQSRALVEERLRRERDAVTSPAMAAAVQEMNRARNVHREAVGVMSAKLSEERRRVGAALRWMASHLQAEHGMSSDDVLPVIARELNLSDASAKFAVGRRVDVLGARAATVVLEHDGLDA